MGAEMAGDSACTETRLMDGLVAFVLGSLSTGKYQTWLIRLSVFALFLFTGSVVFWLYIAAWVLISKRSSRWVGEVYEGEVIR